MRARLAILKIQYGWQQLSLKHGGEGFEIVGVINPTFQISPNIVFEEVNATPFSIKHKDVVVDTTLDRPPSASDSRPVQGAGSSKYESAVVSQGVAPAGQAGPLISPITGPGPVENLSRGPAGRVDPANPNLNPATNPDATLFLGQRQLNDSDLYKRRPDTLVQQNVGGQLVSSISIEATLDAELKQGHKRTQMAESILAAQSVLSRFPNVATPLQLYYIIVAPVPIPSDVRTKIITDLESISKHVSANVTVKWIVVPIA
jgi:hypothetical protein